MTLRSVISDLFRRGVPVLLTAVLAACPVCAETESFVDAAPSETESFGEMALPEEEAFADAAFSETEASEDTASPETEPLEEAALPEAESFGEMAFSVEDATSEIVEPEEGFEEEAGFSEPEEETPEAGESGRGTEQQGPAGSHVKGIRNFSLVEGMVPDPMAGVSWDDTIGTVLCDASSVDWGKIGTQKLTYTIAFMDQTIAYQTIDVTVHENLEYYIYGMEGQKNVIVGSSFDPMEGITYDDKIKSVEPDTSALDTSREGEYPVSYTLTDDTGRTQTAVRRIRVTASGSAGWDNSDSAGNYSTVTDLGVWRLTAYMDTPEDQGPYVGQTASGAPLIPGRTVAVSAATCARLGLYFGDKLLIDGHVYTLEDHGGSAMNDQNWADIFVDNPIDEFSERFNRYSQVYLLR